MGEKVRYRLRVSAAAHELLEEMSKTQTEGDVPVYDFVPWSHDYIAPGDSFVRVAECYASIAEAENQSRTEFSEEIFQRAFDVYIADYPSAFERCLMIHASGDYADIETVHALVRQVVKQSLTNAITRSL
jgi:hypothetical protein